MTTPTEPTTTHTARAQHTASGAYVAICDCGWSDFPRLNWSGAMRDVAYHLHGVGEHVLYCSYCQDEQLGLTVRHDPR